MFFCNCKKLYGKHTGSFSYSANNRQSIFFSHIHICLFRILLTSTNVYFVFSSHLQMLTSYISHIYKCLFRILFTSTNAYLIYFSHLQMLISQLLTSTNAYFLYSHRSRFFLFSSSRRFQFWPRRFSEQFERELQGEGTSKIPLPHASFVQNSRLYSFSDFNTGIFLLPMQFIKNIFLFHHHKHFTSLAFLLNSTITFIFYNDRWGGNFILIRNKMAKTNLSFTIT